jgi:hypothetical protein
VKLTERWESYNGSKKCDIKAERREETLCPGSPLYRERHRYKGVALAGRYGDPAFEPE